MRNVKIAIAALLLAPLVVKADGADPTPSTYEFTITQNDGTLFYKNISRISVVVLAEGPYIRFHDGATGLAMLLPLCEDPDRPDCVAADGVVLNESHPHQ